ncbi:phytoene desaturase [Candidatus Peregrinibacteria bacterium]|nr:phytoene desaturase [Candidatus Peregrinibacteria bacterium]
MSSKKKVIIIGAGPGGLTSAMILAYRGFDVTVYEKDNKVGGRNQEMEFDGFKFDVGPTFLMMKFVLDEVFEESGKNIDDYLKFKRLDPMYRLVFDSNTLDLSDNPNKKKEALLSKFGNTDGYDKFLKREKKRFDVMYPCLQKSYHRFATYFEKELIRAFPRLSLTRNMFGELGKYFKSDDEKISFTFQSKYLGMSPWECPAAFLIIPYIEHHFGIYHVMGGLSEISKAMEKVAKENGAKIELNKPVKELIIEKGAVKGVVLENGQKQLADETIINADFAYAMTKLAGKHTKKYTAKKMNKKKFSCSTFMLYLGLDKIYKNVPHHNIIFSKDYKTYVNNIFRKHTLSDKDLSIYVRNASINDDQLAPAGKSGLYVLIPVPNHRGKIDWKSITASLRQEAINTISNKLNIPDLKNHIEAEKIITPDDWQNKHNVYIGATFNLAHTISQMLYMRPHNKFEEFENCYLVGGGTHPGSGLPTIYESGRISSNLISRKYKVQFETKNHYVK